MQTEFWSAIKNFDLMNELELFVRHHEPLKIPLKKFQNPQTVELLFPIYDPETLRIRSQATILKHCKLLILGMIGESLVTLPKQEAKIKLKFCAIFQNTFSKIKKNLFTNFS
jgi:hypothetical protein